MHVRDCSIDHVILSHTCMWFSLLLSKAAARGMVRAQPFPRTQALAAVQTVPDGHCDLVNCQGEQWQPDEDSSLG